MLSLHVRLMVVGDREHASVAGCTVDIGDKSVTFLGLFIDIPTFIVQDPGPMFQISAELRELRRLRNFSVKHRITMSNALHHCQESCDQFRMNPIEVTAVALV